MSEHPRAAAPTPLRPPMATLLAERGLLLAYINVIMRDLHAAEDVLQEALLVAMSETFTGDDHARAWIRVTARNLALAARRRRQRGAVLADDVLDLLEPEWRHEAEDGHAHGARLAALRACCDLLSGAAKRLIDLRFTSGLDGSGIAAALGRPINTVYVGLSRVYRRLAECIATRLEDA